MEFCFEVASQALIMEYFTVYFVMCALVGKLHVSYMKPCDINFSKLSLRFEKSYMYVAWL